MLIKLFYIFLLALFVVIVLIPSISRLAVSMGILDKCDERKVHKYDTPRLGGVAIFFAFLLAYLLFCELNLEARGFLAGSIIIFLTGLADDLTDLNPKQKILGQTVAVLTAVIIGGFSLSSLGDLFGMGEIRLGMLAVPFTVLTIVGVINAVNLLDGMDGLAGGVSVIAAGAIGILAFDTGNWQLLCMTTALAGAMVGFLRYNSNPAVIFMGDSGSLFLGYCMGFFSVMLVAESKGAISEVTPVIILAVPIFDTLYIIGRRLKASTNPFAPDNNHIHHRFFALGIGYKFTVIILYIFSYSLATLAVLYHRSPDYVLLAMLALAYPSLYFLLKLLSQRVGLKRRQLLESNLTYRETSFYSRLSASSGYLKTCVKCLLVVVLFLSVLAPSAQSREIALAGVILLGLSAVLFLTTKDWGNRFLLFVLFFDGAFIIYQMENMGRASTIFNMPLLLFSNVLFTIILLLVGLKVVLQKRLGDMFGTPLEYLIFFIIISVPLLPLEITGRYHLLSVAGKSIILFAAYKFVLMDQALKSRGIIMATMAALLLVSFKSMISF